MTRAAKRKTPVRPTRPRRRLTKPAPRKRASKPLPVALPAQPEVREGDHSYDCLFGREWKRVWWVRALTDELQLERILARYGSATVIRDAATRAVVWHRKDIKGADALVAALDRISKLASAWIEFKEVSAPAATTAVFEVHSKETGFVLGSVKWFGQWRGYAYFPEPYTVYEPTCLRDVADFIEAHNEEHRARLRTWYAMGGKKRAA
jgi:hypothetical protein